MCCQTVELEPEDCVLDPTLGDAGCWRSVNGRDIEGLGGSVGLDATTWASDSHATHQDPNGTNCQTFVGGIPPAVLDAMGLTSTEVLIACFLRLGVANSRGLWTQAASCPLAAPDYIDACEQRNLDEGRIGC